MINASDDALCSVFNAQCPMLPHACPLNASSDSSPSPSSKQDVRYAELRLKEASASPSRDFVVMWSSNVNDWYPSIRAQPCAEALYLSREEMGNAS